MYDTSTRGEQQTIASFADLKKDVVKISGCCRDPLPALATFQIATRCTATVCGMSSNFVIGQSINNTALLVFLMQAGFTMLEAGSVRERNVSG
jgi:hypothetical protein